MDGRAKYSTILHGLGFDGVRRTGRVLIYPDVRRETTKRHKADKIVVVSPVAQFTGEGKKLERKIGR